MRLTYLLHSATTLMTSQGVGAMSLTYLLQKVNGKYSKLRDDSRRNYLFWLVSNL
jgi:hypothetical protein